MLKIKLNSVFVEDQEKALKFYTEVLGFVKMLDIPVGPLRWLTVASPEEPDGTQLVLEPGVNPIAQTYMKALYEQSIPITAFAVDDIQQETARLQKLGVQFKMEPTRIDTTTFAMFDDTCGNWIQIYQVDG